MALPHDDAVKLQLLGLLASAPNGRMHCQDVYVTLARKFPQLTEDERKIPYRRSVSHWANRVQWARDHLRREGFILHPTAGGGRCYWSISEQGRAHLVQLKAEIDRLFADLDQLTLNKAQPTSDHLGRT